MDLAPLQVVAHHRCAIEGGQIAGVVVGRQATLAEGSPPLQRGSFTRGR